jgi:hypothetical protein
MSCSVNHSTLVTKFCPVCGEPAIQARGITFQSEPQNPAPEKRWRRKEIGLTPSKNRDTTNDNLSQRRKINKFILIPTAILVLIIGSGSIYYVGVQSDKAAFGEECRISVPKILEKFRDLEGTSYKPGPFGVVKPSQTVLELKGVVANLKKSAEDNSMYSGARETLSTLEIFTKSFSDFQTIQNKKFRIEISNPHSSTLQVAWNMYANGLSANLFNDFWQRTMKKILEDYEYKWDSHVSRNYSRADQNKLNEAAEVVKNEITTMTETCRLART